MRMLIVSESYQNYQIWAMSNQLTNICKCATIIRPVFLFTSTVDAVYPYPLYLNKVPKYKILDIFFCLGYLHSFPGISRLLLPVQVNITSIKLSASKL
jgi:hypothetical protein